VPLRAFDDHRHVAHVLPLTSGARRQAGVAYSAAATVFVRKVSLDTRSPMEAIARLYKLTVSELRVLQAIVEVGGVPAVAETFGISESTVKTHLHRVFAKTGLKRQVDLANLVAAHASPFRDRSRGYQSEFCTPAISDVRRGSDPRVPAIFSLSATRQRRGPVTEACGPGTVETSKVIFTRTSEVQRDVVALRTVDGCVRRLSAWCSVLQFDERTR